MITEKPSVHQELLIISERILCSAGFITAHSEVEIGWQQILADGRQLSIEADLLVPGKRGLNVMRAELAVDDYDTTMQMVVDRSWRKDFIAKINEDPFAIFMLDVFREHQANRYAKIF